MTITLAVLLALQFLSLAVLMFGDIGFDHPGRFGLSFNHGLFFTISYIVALLSGLACAKIKKSWGVAVSQIVIPLLILAFLYRPVPQYRAQDYQYLVGKSKSDVQSVLSSRAAISGFQGGIDGDYAFTSYRGLTVFYGGDGTVEKVSDNSP